MNDGVKDTRAFDSSGTPANRYSLMREIFFAVCEQPDANRTAFLECACPDDPTLRSEIEAMLVLESSHPRFLADPVFDADNMSRLTQLTGDACEADAIPAIIGPFRIIRLVAEGGMGMVYEAEQDSPRRRVAVKVIKPGFLSRQADRRFEQEVQLLGRLHHRGIAQIFQAGVVESASPAGHVRRQRYFAMEFIEGMTLTAHAAVHELSTRQQMELLASIAEAVQYGHQRGVIHRDLKPSNILIDADGQPKLIDFGVARAVDHDTLHLSMQTNSGQLLGTLAYMSPEQVSGNQTAVDVRSDIYALGVLGYELLSGRLPYDLTDKNLPEAARIIRDEEPSQMSSISRMFRGDIETIIGRAMEKDAVRRYQSAAELAADIHRYLRDEPILARPPTTPYQLMKFARRHRELAAGLLLVFITLLAGIVGVSLALIRSRAHERAAMTAKVQAERLNESMQKFFEAARPGTPGGGGQMTVEEMLNLSSPVVLDELSDSPDVQIALRRTLGQTYARLGSYKLALDHFDQAIALAEILYGPEAIETLDVSSERGLWLASMPSDQLHAWVESGRIALDKARVLVPHSHPAIQRLLMSRARLETALWRPWEAEDALRELLDIVANAPIKQRMFTETEVRAALIFPLFSQHKFQEAEPMALRVLADINAAGESAQGFELQLIALTNLALLSNSQQRLDEAIAYSSGILAESRSVLGDENPRLATLASRHAWLLTQRRRFDDALKWRAFERNIYEKHEPDSKLIADIRSYEAFLHDQLEHPVEAREGMKKAIARRRASHGDDWLAQEWWRGGVAMEGGLFRSWSSDAIRRQTLWDMKRSLRAAPTTQFNLQELRWSELTFALQQWNGVELDDIIAGDLAMLRSMTDPLPGLYWLSIEIPRDAQEPLHTGAWLLMADWRLDLSRQFRQTLPELWHKPMAGLVHEARVANALIMENEPTQAFGPAGAELSFTLEVTAKITLPPGQYRITIESDDGSIVWLDELEVINVWAEPVQHGRKGNYNVVFDGLAHDLKVRYFQHGQNAMLRLHAEPLSESLTPRAP